MFRTYCKIVLSAIWLFSAATGLCGNGRTISFGELPVAPVTPDTIYQYDTVYEIFFVYDTVYIEESLKKPEIMVDDTVVNKLDTLNRMFLSKRDISRDTSGNIVDLAGFRLKRNKRIKDSDDPSKPKTERAPELKEGKIRKPKQPDHDIIIRRFTEIPFAFYLSDTLFYSDTVMIFEHAEDTGFYFQLALKSDTSISRKTTIRNRPNLVIVNELVKISVKNKSYVLADENPSTRFYQPFFEIIKSDPDAGIIKTSTYLKSKRNLHRKTLKNRFKAVDLKSGSLRPGSTPRKGFNNGTDQYLFVKSGTDLTFPAIRFFAESPEYETNIDLLNQSIETQSSYGTGGGLVYYRNNWGIESGMYFSKHNFLLNSVSTVETRDTSWYWRSFNSEKYEYDTTWYIDINHWLATGDTILIPSVDSLLSTYTDSTLSARVDTAFRQVANKYRLSFSYFEIPVIYRYPLLNGRLFCDAAVGIIPAVMYLRSGNIISPASGLRMDVNDVSFDYDINLSVYAALSFGYKFTGRWALMAEPYYRKTVITGLQNQQFRMHTDMWGIQIALTFRL